MVCCQSSSRRQVCPAQSFEVCLSPLDWYDVATLAVCLGCYRRLPNGFSQTVFTLRGSAVSLAWLAFSPQKWTVPGG